MNRIDWWFVLRGAFWALLIFLIGCLFQVVFSISNTLGEMLILACLLSLLGFIIAKLNE